MFCGLFDWLVACLCAFEYFVCVSVVLCGFVVWLCLCVHVWLFGWLDCVFICFFVDFNVFG